MSPPTPPPSTPVPTVTYPQPTPKKHAHKWLPTMLLIILVVASVISVWWWLTSSRQPQAITLTYWGIGESEATLKPFFDKFTETNPHVTIKYLNNSPQEYRQRLMNQLASENPQPDLFRFHNTWVPMLREWLSPVPPEAFTPQEYQQTFYPVIQKDLKVGATYVGIPLSIDGLGMYYNEDLFITSAQPLPKDWQELRQTAQQLTVKDPNKNLQIAGTALGLTANIDHWPDILAVMMIQAGADLAKPNTKGGQEALTFYSLFSAADQVWDSTLPNSTLAFATGKLALYFGPAWEAPLIKQLSEKNGTAVRFKVMPIPQLPEVNITWASYWVEGVSNKSNRAAQVAAWQLLTYLAQPDTMERLYQLQTQERGFGLPYSRVDLADQLKNHPQLGAFVLQAPAARSWYLASDTTDVGGINDRLIKLYQQAVETMANKGRGNAERALKIITPGIDTVLKEYGAQ